MAEQKKKLTPEQVQSAAAKVLAKVREVNLRARGSVGLLGLVDCAKWVVHAVEEVGAEVGALGPDKKDIAVKAVLALVPDAWCPDWILEPLVSWAIEKAVAALKAKLAKVSHG